MLKIAVLVSGGGTNLQAIIDSIARGDITDTKIAAVVSNNPGAYALKRAEEAGLTTKCISPRSFESRELFNQALTDYLVKSGADLIVLAGFMVVVPAQLISAFKNRIINIHPSLIPSFCGKGYYGLHVHEAALKRGVKVSEGTDTGPIIMQKPVEVLPDDTPQILQRRIMEQAEWKIMPRVIDLIAHDRVHIKDGKVYISQEGD